MTPEEATALVTAAGVTLTALGTVLIQVRGLRKDVNGLLTRYTSAATAAAEKEGELKGRDFVPPPAAAPEPEVRERT